jgi:hypothetical protein
MTRSVPAINLIVPVLSLSLIVLLDTYPWVAAQADSRSRVVTTKKLAKPTPEPTPLPVAKPNARKIPVQAKYLDYCAPPFFFCPDACEIFTVLLENNYSFSKGKFEKTAEWEARRTTLLDNFRLNDDLTMGSEMTFLYVQGTDAPQKNEPVYDADLEQWSFGLHFHPGPDATTCLPIVSRKNEGLFCLVVPFDLSNVTAAIVEMSIAEAEKNDGFLQIALVGRVIAKDVYSHGFKVWGFFFDLKEMICINPKTGDSWKVKYVLAKPDSAAPPK